MMFWYGAHWMWWQAGLSLIGMILFWGLIIWGVYALIRIASRRPGSAEHGAGEHGTGEHGGDARRILDERLARGEIDADEYRRLRDLISSSDDRPPVHLGKAS